ncbi:MAG: hypothetical protein IT304_08005 [Dehalococcoidia bacterium]|nr:hypothetical protein [Dehalococcoidia bacterium]
MSRKPIGAGWAVVLALLALLALGVAACGDDDNGGATKTSTGGGGPSDAAMKAAGFKTITVDKDQPIKIGISSALSGDVKGLGVPIADSAETAVKA